MKLQELFEAVDTTSVESEAIKGMKEHIDQIARMLFDVHAGPVKDLKRSKDAKFFGVAHHRSILTDASGKVLHLTFDNSTDSGEFEINSLVPLLIERHSPEDLKILALYRKYGVHSKKKLSYIAHGDKIVLREIHLGSDIDANTVKFARAVLRILRGEVDVDTEEQKEEPKVDPKDKKAKEVK